MHVRGWWERLCNTFLVDEIYKRDRIANRYSNITKNMFTMNSGPKLKGKAACVKDLGPVVHEIWKRYYTKGNPTHDKIEYMLRCSAHLDAVLDANTSEFVLSDEPAKDLIATGFSYLHIWSQVADELKSDKLFGMTAKSHLLMHCCLLSRISAMPHINKNRQAQHAQTKVRHTSGTRGGEYRTCLPELVDNQTYQTTRNTT